MVLLSNEEWRLIARFQLITYKCKVGLDNCAFDSIWADGFDPSEVPATCPTGQYYTDEKCVPICGDGVRVDPEVCDYAFSSSFAIADLREVFLCDDYCENYLPDFEYQEFPMAQGQCENNNCIKASVWDNFSSCGNGIVDATEDCDGHIGCNALCDGPLPGWICTDRNN